MKNAYVVIGFCLSLLLAGCSSPEEEQRRADNKLLNQIWDDYHNLSGNRGLDDRNPKGSIVKRGTVPPSAMNSSIEGRLPAHVACYDFLSVMQWGDTKSHICIYHISNPSIGRSQMQWRGNVDDLEKIMQNDGFAKK
jgi:hypothetical protein